MQLLSIMLTKLGHTPILFDSFLVEGQLADLETNYHLHKPKVIIVFFEEEDRDFGQKLCEQIRGNPLTQNIRLLYLVTRKMDVHIHWLPSKNPCFADEYLTIPFDPEDLQKKLLHLINKPSDQS